ncbi:hypothetical protein GQ457_01G045910 [Hibiscus cannabinus]
MDPAELRRMFQMFDKNGDGKITNKELSESLENLGIFIPSTELIQMVEKIDVNGDGYVDIDEFGALYQTIMHERDEEEDMMEAFNVFDQNRDGFITVEELRSVLSSLGLKQGRTLEDCKRMIQKVDVDGDGMVNYKEFKQMMKGGGFAALRSLVSMGLLEHGIGLFDYEMSPWEVCMPLPVVVSLWAAFASVVVLLGLSPFDVPLSLIQYRGNMSQGTSSRRSLPPQSRV